jgi:sugar transferase (PEP-CTERM system associated)
MVRIFQHYVSARLALLVLLETVVVVVAAYAGTSLQFPDANTPARTALAPAVAAFPVAMLLFVTGLGLYQVDAWHQLKSFRARLIAAGVLAGGVAYLMARLTSSAAPEADRLILIVAAALTGSALVRFGFYRLDRAVALRPRLLVLGTGSRVVKFAELAERSRSHVVVGYVATRPGTHYVPGSKVLSPAPGESLLALVERHRVEQVVVAVRDRRDGGATIQELLKCKLRGVKIIELSTFFEREYRQVMLESLNPAWLVFGDGFRQGPLRALLKRLFDLVVSGLLLAVALPVMLLAALCILFESGRPVLYRQERVGQGGRRFTIYKLRTMVQDAERGTPRWASADDSRTTPVGRMLRKFRIDELPQVFNVIKGDMSFVGPRPERPVFVEQLTQQIPYYALRHNVKPGITGWAQVCYPYGACIDDAVEKLQYDLYYVKNGTLFLDLLILFATIEVVLWGKGAR